MRVRDAQVRVLAELVARASDGAAAGRAPTMAEQ
jgi:hypothetical protein